MNKIYIAIGIITLISAAAAMLLSCSPKTKPAVVPTPERDSTNENVITGIGDTLISFRFESFTTPVFYDSEVYALDMLSKGSYLYYRKSGNFNGYSMGTFDAGNIYADFEKAISDFSLAEYPFTSFDDEKKDQNRWMIRLKYKDGHQISIIRYLDNTIAEKDKNLMDSVRGIFEKLLKYIDENDIQCESSKYTYGSNGKLNRRIDYTADGIVRGGWDADDPLASF